MKLLLDTNIVLDLLLEREDHTAAEAVFRSPHRLFMTASAVTDIHYVTRRNLDRDAARELLRDLLASCQPLDVTEADLV
ncbi:MAG: PIN domain-containing protein, partial [Bifidobacteriaceae bacterium]|nr:PIN domain-containing protein [Bifidobacteriaceae bacterium]